MRILFAGLGRMGNPMASHLVRAGHNVHVYNRTQAKAVAWVEQHGGALYDASLHYDALILCVRGDDDVVELAVQQKLMERIVSYGYVIDHSTTSIMCAQNMAQIAQKYGVFFCDAPVSGGEIGAVRGSLTCMLGCQQEHFAVISQLIQAYCTNVTRIGDVGAGQAAKMANQLCIAGALAGLSEAIVLLERMEMPMDMSKIYEAISMGAAQSWQMEHRFSTMVEGTYDFGFSILHMIKDLGFALTQAQQQGWQPDMTQRVYARYQAMCVDPEVHAYDTSSLIESYRRTCAEE